MDSILLLGAGQGAVLAAILFARHRGNRRANRWLALVLLSFSGAIALHVLSHAGHLPALQPHDLVITLGLLPLGPLVWWYTRALTDPAYSFRSRDLAHFLPFAAGLGTASVLAAGSPASLAPFNDLCGVVLALLVPVYFLLCLLRLVRFGRALRERYSSIEHLRLRWLRVFLLMLLGAWLAPPVAGRLFAAHEQWNYVWLAVSAILYLVGYSGLLQPEIFSGAAAPGAPVSGDPAGGGRKYGKSALTPEQAARAFAKLERAMDEARHFLDSELDLPGLAAALGMSTHHLSQVINEKTGGSFYDYVNGRRVEEAKRILRDATKRHLGLASVCFEAGFNSLSAFNAAFKKHVGMPPSRFRDRPA